MARHPRSFTASNLAVLDPRDGEHWPVIAGLRRALADEVPAAAPLPGTARGSDLRVAFAVCDPPRSEAEDAAAVGYIAVVGGVSSWQIDELFVHPAYRRRAAGTLVLLAAVDAARLAGCSQITASVPADADAAAALFRAAGFIADQPARGRVRFALPLPFFSFKASVVMHGIAR